MKIPIVIVAYNRPRSLNRLLTSVSNAYYPDGSIDLIISIDKGANNQDVLDLAHKFNWQHGDKKVVYQEVNLGLRKHILKCGGLSLEYGAVIVLEDDLFVSPNFYLFTKQALQFSSGKESIGGISLYSHKLNVHTRDNFSPLEDGFDNWYFQFASSWGQAWTKEQWSGFMDWYHKNPDIDSNKDVPAYVRSWSPKSWLKYNIAYLIEKDYYFLYPKIALATNFSDAGTHVGNDSTIYQVPLDHGERREYRFSEINTGKAIYDAFFESKILGEVLGLNNDELLIDLYGYKKNYPRRYVLTSRIMDFKILKSYGKSLKPQEDNVLRNIEGTELFLYDTSVTEGNPHQVDTYRKATYNFKQIPLRTAKMVFKKLIFSKFRGISNKLLKR